MFLATINQRILRIVGILIFIHVNVPNFSDTRPARLFSLNRESSA